MCATKQDFNATCSPQPVPIWNCSWLHGTTTMNTSPLLVLTVEEGNTSLTVKDVPIKTRETLTALRPGPAYKMFVLGTNIPYTFVTGSPTTSDIAFRFTNLIIDNKVQDIDSMDDRMLEERFVGCCCCVEDTGTNMDKQIQTTSSYI